ncbi:hypothetical protein [Actinomadura sp. 9N215]|uniref:hypothetical protein n=1 Tax=Actinomadura sp. 9N215 TaxID=3375150 RepID=UPI0037B86891
MGDTESRTLATDIIEVRPGLVVEVRTMFTVHAETDDHGTPITPLWETTSVVMEQTVEGHMTHGAAKQGHAFTVQRFKAAASHTGAHEATPAGGMP